MDRGRSGISSATDFPPRRTRSGQGLCRPRDGRQFRRIFPSRLFHPHSSARFRLFSSCGHFVVGSALFGPPRGRPHDRLFAGNSADGRHPPPPLSLQQILLIRRLHPPSRSFGRLQYHPDVRGRGRRWKYAGQETAVPFRQRLRRRRRFALRRVFPSLTSAQSSGYSGGGKFSNSSRRMKTFLVNGCMNHITMMQVWNNYTA